MPYESINQLPEAVKSAIPGSAGRTIFMKAFNSAYEGTCKDRGEQREGCAMSIAWTALKNAKYKKSEAGKWVKNMDEPKEKIVITNAMDEPLTSSHDAILQTLDAKVNGRYHPISSFEKSLESWNGIPIVFSDSDHPDPFTFRTDPEGELEKIHGRIVGEVENAHITTAGHARLMASLSLTDPVMEERIKKGELSLSTCFLSAKDDVFVDGIEPNHVLVFTEGVLTPKDKGTGILNAGKVISGRNKSRFEDVLENLRSLFADMTKGDVKDEEILEGESKMGEEPPKEPEQTPEIDVTKDIEKLKGQIAELNAEVAKKDEELKLFREKDEQRAKELRDTQWEEVKKAIPVGELHEEGAEAKLREDFEKDPHTFAVKLAKTPKKNAIEQEGQEYESEEEEDLALQRELLTRTGRK